MNIKSLLLGSAAALVAVTGARAADAVVVAEPEPVEYVRVCDAYGAGFFYIPGTETCLKIDGYVRSDIQGGDDVYSGAERDSYDWRARALLRFDARSETELGTLRSFAELRYNFKNGADADKVDLNQATIELGGFQVGAADSQFTSWTGYLGDIINDDVIGEGRYVTNQISYTFSGGNGFSALIGLEQGSGSTGTIDLNSGDDIGSVSHVIDDYAPHVVAGGKVEQGWGSVSAVVGYDTVVEEFAGKLRADVKFSDSISAWVMGGYQSDWDKTEIVEEEELFVGNYFAPWFGDWAVWGGVAIKATEQATVNAQLAYEDDGTFAAALNVGYELVPGFKITPEINYTKFDGQRAESVEAVGGKDSAFGGIVRFQRNF
ncbi:porin [Phyllobacterium lublinensis]|uniref:porin n=1 Tax=Phyllobacterium lublinensis TaxID=2875708 RepID=UPI001CCC779D|nr:porin [Phyllobacterium sp. 2063]MBZ9655062.1 porin [Phyllobacterium sp. 2063]